MSCPRCSGLLVPESLEDRESTYLKCLAFKCVSCGNVVDPLITKHRQLGQPSLQRVTGRII